MPLQNRVSPFGELFASPARGTMFGNRGGKFHRDDKTLGSKRFASRQWICCVLQFKNRQRDVWGRYYTELFFLDEVTALAAGHRPCFECRREEAKRSRLHLRKGRGYRRRCARRKWIASCMPSGWMDATNGCIDGRSMNCLMAYLSLFHRRRLELIAARQVNPPPAKRRGGSRAIQAMTVSVARKARGVGGASASNKKIPPPLTPPRHFAALNGGRGTQRLALASCSRQHPIEAVDSRPDDARRSVFVIRGNDLLRWTPEGYDRSIPRPARHRRRCAHAAVDRRGAR